MVVHEKPYEVLIKLEKNLRNKPIKSHLKEGIPCRIHSCIKCCIKTTMALCKDDVERIKKLGYKEKSFLYKKGSIFMIKNKNGKCFFLKNFGCSIYEHRPLGCRLYPLVYDSKNGFVLDKFCPYRNEFKFSRKDIEELINLIYSLKAF